MLVMFLQYLLLPVLFWWPDEGIPVNFKQYNQDSERHCSVIRPAGLVTRLSNQSCDEFRVLLEALPELHQIEVRHPKTSVQADTRFSHRGWQEMTGDFKTVGSLKWTDPFFQVTRAQSAAVCTKGILPTTGLPPRAPPLKNCRPGVPPIFCTHGLPCVVAKCPASEFSTAVYRFGRLHGKTK